MKNELDSKIKQEIIDQVNYIFEPIGGVFKNFGEIREMYCSIRDSYSMESVIQEKNKIIMYPVKIETSLGDISITLHSDIFHDIKSAIGIAFSYSDISKMNINQEKIKSIQDRIYL